MGSRAATSSTVPAGCTSKSAMSPSLSPQDQRTCIQRRRLRCRQTRRSVVILFHEHLPCRIPPPSINSWRANLIPHPCSVTPHKTAMVLHTRPRSLSSLKPWRIVPSARRKKQPKDPGEVRFPIISTHSMPLETTSLAYLSTSNSPKPPTLIKRGSCTKTSWSIALTT